MLPIYEKHKRLHAAEVKNVLLSFGHIMNSIFCKRIASILVEANSTAATTKEQIPEDVTFHASAGNAGNATGADHTRASLHTSPAPHMSAAAQEVEVDREVGGCPDTNQNGDHQEIVLDKMQSCDKLGKEDVQLGKDKGKWEEVVVPEYVAGDPKVSGVAGEDERVILSQGTVAALAGLALALEFYHRVRSWKLQIALSPPLMCKNLFQQGPPLTTPHCLQGRAAAQSFYCNTKHQLLVLTLIQSFKSRLIPGNPYMMHLQLHSQLHLYLQCNKIDQKHSWMSQGRRLSRLAVGALLM